MVRSAALPTSTIRRQIRIHFDLNRTVLMSDAVGGRNMENTVNYLLSECAWGKVIDGSWHCESSIPSPGIAPSGTEHLVTYKSFVDKSFPYHSMKDDGNISLSIDKVKAHNKTMKKQRTALQSCFTNESSPGASLAPAFNDVMSKLSFTYLTDDDDNHYNTDTRLGQAWKAGRYYLLPSFINALFFMDEFNKKESQVEFRVVFRTFGDDLPDVAAEIQYLIEGKHPLYPGKCLSPSFGRDIKSGVFYRDETGPSLAVNATTKAPTGTSDLKEFYKESDDVDILCGYRDIYDGINQMFQHGNKVIALRDYWEWWNAHGESGEFGKLLVVDLEEENVLFNVFFDDHIEHDCAHIVDVRDVKNGEVMEFHRTKDRYLRRAEPYLAITDTEYYVDKIKDLL